MSKSKYKVTKGLAQVITTGEPVFVKGFGQRTDLFGDNETVATVIRPVVTQNGIEHKREEIPLEELETRHEQFKRNLEFDSFARGLQEEAEAKRYALPEKTKQFLQDAVAAKNLTPTIEG